MRLKQHQIHLSVSDRTYLEQVVRSSMAPTKRQRAQILLKADENQPGGSWPDRQVAESYGCSLRNVQRLRLRTLIHGVRCVIEGAYGNRPYVRKVDGKVEATLIALCCGPKPDGRSSWTLKLLADKLVELEVIDSIAPSTVHEVLKKMNLSLGAKSSGA